MSFQTPFDDPNPQTPSQGTQSGKQTPTQELATEENNENVAELYEKVQNQLNSIRQDQEQNPLITDELDFAILQTEFEGAQNFLDKIDVRIQHPILTTFLLTFFLNYF